MKAILDVLRHAAAQKPGQSDKTQENELPGKLVPTNPQHDDLYIVEFPKSGITWLSFLLANAELAMAEGRVPSDVNFMNITDFVADIHLTKNISAKNSALFQGRIIKSHSCVCRDYLKVIYLVRDPRSVMVSYYNYLTSQKRFRGSISDMIRSPEFGIDSWRRHVDDWLNRSAVWQRIYFLTYENLVANPCNELRRLLAAFGVDIDLDSAKDVVRRSAFSEMKELERQRAETDVRRWKGERFGEFQMVATGGDRFHALEPSERSYIEQRTSDLMSLFNWTCTRT